MATIGVQIMAELKATDRILRDYDELELFIARVREKGVKIVMTQGTFDMVHIGHGRYLQAAKDHGDLLIVGIDNDEKVKHRKGPDRPVVPEDERLEMLTFLRPVDVVFCKQLADPKWKLIKTVQPDVLIVIDENYTDEQRQDLENYCGEVKVLDRQATTSTSAKLRFMQMGAAKKLVNSLTPKLIQAVEESLSEVNGEAGKKPDNK